MKTFEQLRFDNRYHTLGGGFISRVKPEPRGRLHMVAYNQALAERLDLHPDQALRADLPTLLAGARGLPGADPAATVYAGHQFGVWVPRLGDGRAHLLGEVVTDSGERWEVQLKGSGPTPYSRMGDGYAVLRSTVREYLAGEAMHGLGIPTTRALAIIGSDAPVYREVAESGAVLVRVAASHLRFGTFEYFAHGGQYDRLRHLLAYTIEGFHPHIASRASGEREAQWFREVVHRTANLMADWHAVGFAHGVMNTDNMSVLGLTLDYGPYGFLDAYQPGWICNHSDTAGRYAFNRQPAVGLWNLTCLAQALLPAIEETVMREALEEYWAVFNDTFLERMRPKLGIAGVRQGDGTLIMDWLQLLARSGADYTNSFRALCRWRPGHDPDGLRHRFADRDAFDAWTARYAERLGVDDTPYEDRCQRMETVNPRYVLRNYLVQQAIEQAEDGNFGEIERLRELLSDPFRNRPGMERYAAEPPDWGRHLEISCSS